MELVSLRTGKDGRPALIGALQRAVRGEVRFDAGSRALYAADASNYRHVPTGVVFPRDAQDVLLTLEACRRHGVPVLSRGGGTSLGGQTTNVAVVLDFSRYMNGVLQIDVDGRSARVLPGTVLDLLRDEATKYGLTFGPDPSTHDRCTLGGMIGNSACGIHAVMSEFYGPGPRTEDNVEELEIVTYDGLRMRVGPTSEEDLRRIVNEGGRRGEVYRRLAELRDRYADAIRERFPDVPRRVSGYNLTELLPERGFNVARALVGSEGTCVTVLEATVTLVDALPARSLLVVGYSSVYEVGDVIPCVREQRPVGCEGLDRRLIDYDQKKGAHARDLSMLPDGDGWLLIEFGADTKEEADEQARRCLDALQRQSPKPTGHRLMDDPSAEARIWAVRESALGATAFAPNEKDTWPGWEDAAVPVDRVGVYLREFRQLLEQHGYDCSLYGHFGQGCVHTRIDFDFSSKEGMDRYAAFTAEAADLVVRHGGSLSGEHGDGQARSDLLPKMYGSELMNAFREFKAIWDPDGKMNPGRIVDPSPRTADLRLGPGYQPERPDTYFSYPEDGGDFSHATVRCVGVGKCRREDGGTMCPSWRVTHDEQHTTRGRAHLLFEMLRGEVITDGWQSEEVKASLDLCLACKGCKGDCPVDVDIATYKAEFLAHYYEGKRRPRQALAFGYIDVWTSFASKLPSLVNFATHAPGIGRFSKWVAGVSQQREVPRFARQSFRASFAGRSPRGHGKRVLLWPDTFNDAFFPEILSAAVEVLESAGHRVIIPDTKLCCGRALYDYGMLERAKRLWSRTLDELDHEIAAGTPIVGVEPSCVAAFRDELPNLMSDDPRAEKLAGQVRSLSELLTEEGFQPPTLRGNALLHGHCHQKAVWGTDSDQRLLEGMGLDVEAPETGCCGMAGAFGFESDKYEISMQVGELDVLPRVRSTEQKTLIVANGFSCREQVMQATERRPLHLAEAVRLALHQDEILDHEAPPERQLPVRRPRMRASAAALFVAALFVAILLLSLWAPALGAPAPR